LAKGHSLSPTTTVSTHRLAEAMVWLCVISGFALI
jgi:hypothetical protein